MHRKFPYSFKESRNLEILEEKTKEPCRVWLGRNVLWNCTSEIRVAHELDRAFTRIERGTGKHKGLNILYPPVLRRIEQHRVLKLALNSYTAFQLLHSLICFANEFWRSISFLCSI